MFVCWSEVHFQHIFFIKGQERRDLSGETIGIFVGGIVCSVSVSRLVGGLGRSGFLSVLVSVIVSSGLEVAFKFSANRTKTRNCFYGINIPLIHNS